MRVPLLNPVIAVCYRLDIQATWAANPPGTPTTGYDKTFREPIVSKTAAGVREVERVEMTPVDIPCQVEDQSFERVHFVLGGDAPATNMVFVFHRRDLERLSLLDSNRRCLLKPGDRIDHVENRRTGTTVLTFKEPLYIYEVRPRSWGFGPDGYDLEVAYTTHRNALPLGSG